ncbi:unnamed protein product [Didymodactylos carnosus]|uniref:Uncharacterized protein n=1 Tax=Didymodactylos carnosus TaxID=1234261 RepID=A0A814SGS5_9BILA|nr:unnamed protein product [Didymodactylos carnosus]CAF1147916.1 unnamed protein product [Didymodactylos carnosus]CAF3856052.1 unnamed protein product [Didymodactylos carnosus]CAF3911498.1 unnamed protein product [Didymodactylos carnosus]
MDSDLAFCLKDFVQQLCIEQQQAVAQSIFDLCVGSKLASTFSSSFIGAGIADVHGRLPSSGTENFNVPQERMNKKWNRIYTADVQQSSDANVQRVYWEGSIDRGSKPYFCPTGWKRYGIKVANTADEFDERWGQWCIAYHGTEDTNAAPILNSGLRANHGIHGTLGKCVYVSPSIEYSAHPRYAKVRYDPRTGKYHQMIFQCRVNPELIKIFGDTTMEPKWRDKVQIDPHFSNKKLEWVIEASPNGRYIKEDIICYGIMLRTSTGRPGQLPSSHWWQYSNSSLQRMVEPFM